MTYRVAVLRGGPSSEYEVSLKSGASVIKALAQEDEYAIHDILIDRGGVWHRNGIPTTPADALKGVDVAFIALHGSYGEDGTVQRILDTMAIPYTGSGAYASALAMQKPRARFQIAALPMVKLPEHYVVREDDGTDYPAIARDIFARFGPPYIVKPASGGSSVGLAIAPTIAELPGVLRETARAYGYPILVEEFIRGKEVTCGVIEGFRNEECYALPPVEILLPTHKSVLDYEAKYGVAEESCARGICPASLTTEEKRRVEEAARAIHQALDLSHYSRTDFILTPKGLYFLETNSLPGLDERSPMHTSLTSIGSSLREFLKHVIKRATQRD